VSFEPQKIPVQHLFESGGVALYIKRADLIHPLISGNKWWKLKYNLQKAVALGKPVLTFGGAYSNHLVATAVACKASNLKSIGIVRGEAAIPVNPSLAIALQHDMTLKYVSRDLFKKKNSKSFINNLEKEFGEFFLIPEGGTNALAIKGVSEMLSKNEMDFDYICCPVGTGGTMVGMLNVVNSRTKVIGFSSLKGSFLKRSIEELIKKYEISPNCEWEIINDYHFGGYARYNKKLIDFINDFSIPLDPIYTGKMFYGIYDLMKKGYFKKGSRVLAIHTGGLQGVAGFNARFGNLITNLSEEG